MCALMITEGSQVVGLFPGDQLLSKHAWAQVFGIADLTLSAAFVRGEKATLPYDQVRPFPKGGLEVGQLPVIIAGFQAVQERSDGHVFYPWAQNLDIHAATIVIGLPSGRVLEWQATPLDSCRE